LTVAHHSFSLLFTQAKANQLLDFIKYLQAAQLPVFRCPS
jgi:hypothetical protein